MNNSFLLQKPLIRKICLTFAAILFAVILPQIFHTIGMISGTGSMAGSAFLPMHIPVIFAGLLAGPTVGLLAGAISPVISFMFCRMPSAAMLVFIIIELSVYGLAAGMLSKVKLNSFLKLVIIQLSGRFARAAAVLVCLIFAADSGLTGESAYNFILEGIFGILIQWAVIPAAFPYLKRMMDKQG